MPKRLELDHIRFMRRHANLAIAISDEVLGRDLNAVMAEALEEVRRDSARPSPQPWERFDASRRFQPITAIRDLVNRMRATYRARVDVDAAIDHAAEMQARLDRANQRRWEANVLTQIAQDPEVPNEVGPAVVASKPQINRRTRQTWVRRNVNAVLIGAVRAGQAARRFFKRSKTIPEEYYDRLEATMTQGVRKAAEDIAKVRKEAESETRRRARPVPDEPDEPEPPPPPDELIIEFELRETEEARVFEEAARETRERMARERGIARRRGKTIGRDQAEKFNGNATEERNVKVGVDSYRWNTQGDSRVRPAHRARDEKIFSWKQPPTLGLPEGQPSDGHPGEAVECRCWASGNFAEAFKSGQLVARTQQPTPLRRGRQGPIRPDELPEDVDPGQIAFQREVFEAPPNPEQVAREERDRRFGAGG